MTRIRGEQPCSEGRVKWAHLCEIDARTKLGTEAWYRLNEPGARRVDAIRALHAVAGDHDGAHDAVTALTKHPSIMNAQTRTIVRVVRQVERQSAEDEAFSQVFGDLS